MSKYTARGVLVLDDIVSTLFKVIKSNFMSSIKNQDIIILNSAEKCMKNLYLINEIYSDQRLLLNEKIIELDLDFPDWHLNHKEPLDNFKKKVTYKFLIDKNKVNYIQEEINSMTLVRKDKNRAFARYLERRHSETELFKKKYQRLQ